MPNLTSLAIDTPIGPLTIFASDTAVTRLDFAAGKSFSASPQSMAVADQAASELGQYFAGQRKSFDVAVVLLGTDFQKSVWREIERVRFGETKTYAELAGAIGNPKAARAVGGAVGANPVPIIVPCHRIMGAAGKLTGYSGGAGIPTKIQLLKLEGLL
jgi:methylated-DNA-[protein]-cysteine S-methyltransferase